MGICSPRLGRIKGRKFISRKEEVALVNTPDLSKNKLGDQLANFKLERGDYGGIASWSEEGSGITTSSRALDPPNSFGLYGMAGNVSEWVADVYRPIIDEEANDFNYYRGNVYSKPQITRDGKATTIDRENFKDQFIEMENGRLKIFKLLLARLDLTSLQKKI